MTVLDRFQLFFGASLEVLPGAELTLGRGYLNTGGAINCARSIMLGNGVFLGRNVYITDSDHHCIMDADGKVRNEPAAIVIEDHVLVCYGAVILKGVTIGEGSVIGAGAVVTRDIPAHCLAAGTPARVIRREIVWK